MYDYKSDNKQLSAESEMGTFEGLENISSDFKLQKGSLPQWAVDWSKNKFNMDAKDVKFYIMDKPNTDDFIAKASGNDIFVSSDHKNDEEVIKHELTHIYQQAVGSAKKSNANNTELEREAIEVSNERNPHIPKNSKFGQSLVTPKENTGVVQGFNGNAANNNNKDEVVVLCPSQGTVLTSIDAIKYNGCKEIKVDESVTEIDDGTFSAFESLITIDMPNVTEIGYGAFYACTNLKEINMPNVKKIGSGTFEYCESLIKVYMPNVTIIEKGAFSECKRLEEINMSSVTKICDEAFWDCHNLIKIDIPNAAIIEESAFSLCTHLKEINMPNIKEIGKKAFEFCTSLSIVNMQNAKKVDGSTFKDLVNLSSVDISGVEEIGKGAFMNCTNLSRVEMPNVTKIDEAAFWGCTSLSSVDMPSVMKIDEGAFTNCPSLESIDIPNVTEICKKTFFNCTSLTRVEMPKVTKVDEGAFTNCPSLGNIDISNVTEICKKAFFNCISLSNVNISNTMKIGERAFAGCIKLKKVIVSYYCDYDQFAFPDDCKVEYKSIPNISDIDKLKLIQFYETGKIKPGDFLKDIDMSTIDFADEDNYYLLIDALYSESVKLADVISKFKINPEDLLESDKYGFDIYDAYVKSWIAENEIKRLMPNSNLFLKMNTESDTKYYLDCKVGLGDEFKTYLPSFEKLSKTPENIISDFSEAYRFKSSLLNGMRSGIYQYSGNAMTDNRTLTRLISYMRNTGDDDIKLYRGIKDYETVDYMANMPIGSFGKNYQCILGKEIFDRSLTSTTISEDTAKGYTRIKDGNKTAVLLEITVPKGRKLNMMPIANLNNEVVFNKFQKLKVNEVKGKKEGKNNLVVIECEAIEDKDNLCKTEKDIYESSEFKKYQEEFEVDLGKYLYKSDEAYAAVHKGINILKKRNSEENLREIFFSNEIYTTESFSGNVTEFGGQDLTDKEVEALLKDQKPTDEELKSLSTTVAGNLREKLGAFQFAVDNGTLGYSDRYQKSNEFEPHIERRDRTNEDQDKLRRNFDYQDNELQLFRSARERRYQEKFQKNGKTPITYGGMLFQPQYKKRDIESFYGKRLVAGTSGTAMRLLSKYREQISSDKTDLLNFRLVLMACMLPEKNHSLYEILQGSHEAGVKGYENLSTADTMDKTIDPLGEDRVRKEVCKDQKFPYERALKDHSKKNIR